MLEVTGTRERQLPTQISQLISSLDRLEPRIGNLQERLAAVLRSAGPTSQPSMPKDVSVTNMADAPRAVRGVAERIDALCVVVDDILDRLEA